MPDNFSSPVLVSELLRSNSPVEREFAALLSRAPDLSPVELRRLHRYHRKIDVAHKIFVSYDEPIEKPSSATEIGPKSYLALAFVFKAVAQSGADADKLRWANSALNCLDKALPLGEQASVRVLLAQLDDLFDSVVPS